MREELDSKLVSDFHLIFKNRNGSIMETCMAWGFECGDGWEPLIRNTCKVIQHHIDQRNENNEWRKKYNLEHNVNKFNVFDEIQQVTADQIKEKYAGLRFYYSGGDDFIQGVVALAENMSYTICETCSKPGKVRGKGWYYTACDEHTREVDKEELKNV